MAIPYLYTTPVNDAEPVAATDPSTPPTSEPPATAEPTTPPATTEPPFVSALKDFFTGLSAFLTPIFTKIQNIFEEISDLPALIFPPLPAPARPNVDLGTALSHFALPAAAAPATPVDQQADNLVDAAASMTDPAAESGSGAPAPTETAPALVAPTL